MKENFEITATDGKKYWISRAHAVVSCITGVKTTEAGHDLFFLLERRGPGCPDNVGKLAFPCGYVNWDETRLDAVIRETYEEIGLQLLEGNVVEWETIDDPKADTRQNIVTRYIAGLPFEYLIEEMPKILERFRDSAARGGEAAEVSEVLLLSWDEIVDLPEEEFAFGHKSLILDLYDYLDDEFIEDILEL